MAPVRLFVRVRALIAALAVVTFVGTLGAAQVVRRTTLHGAVAGLVSSGVPLGLVVQHKTMTLESLDIETDTRARGSVDDRVTRLRERFPSLRVDTAGAVLRLEEADQPDVVQAWLNEAIVFEAGLSVAASNAVTDLVRRAEGRSLMGDHAPAITRAGCNVGRRVTLSAGNQPLHARLDEIAAATGLAWLVTYETADGPLRVGLMCPDGWAFFVESPIA